MKINLLFLLSCINILSLQGREIEEEDEFKSVCNNELGDQSVELEFYSSGLLKLPSYSDEVLSCSWILKASSEPTEITFSFDDLNFNNSDCSQNYVKIIRGDRMDLFCLKTTDERMVSYIASYSETIRISAYFSNLLNLNSGIHFNTSEISYENVDLVTDTEPNEPVDIIGDIMESFDSDDRLTQYSSGCGSSRYQQGRSGWFQSLDYPNGYKTGLHCVWHITAPANSYILIKFNKGFGINDASSPNCPTDRLSFVHEGRVLMTFCGSNAPSPKIIRTNTLSVTFDTAQSNFDGPYRFTGFQIQWFAISQQSAARVLHPQPKGYQAERSEAACITGIVLRNPSRGIIKSPNYGLSRYPSGANCTWIINPDIALVSGQMFIIKLLFLYFDVESGDLSCKTGDRAEVASIRIDGDRRRGRYCNHKKPPEGDSLDALTANPVTLTFLSDHNGVEGYGFEIRYVVEVSNAPIVPKPGELYLPIFTNMNTCGVIPRGMARFMKRSTDIFEAEAIVDDLEHSDTRIVGGVPARSGTWPWIAELTLDNTHSCGATIINERWIMTAAHCFASAGGAGKSRWRVVVGRYSLYKDNAWNGQRPLVPRIKNIYLHKHYRYRLSKANDIALIELWDSLPYGVLAYAACLPTRELTSSDVCFTAGWGSTLNTGGDGLLKQVRLPIIPDLGQCQTMLGQWGHFLTDTMICAGYESGGRDACQGDSGGPLLCLVDRRWQVHGIVSFGYKCALPNSPGVYTKVLDFVDWIQKVVSSSP